MSFAEQVWLSIVDKVLLGGVVALIGYQATRAIEAYKAKQALRTELTKQRVVKIEGVWKSMIDTASLISPLQKRLVKNWIVPATGQSDEERLKLAREAWCTVVSSENELVDNISEKLEEILLSIERDSFWLGRALTEKAKEQLTSIQSGFNKLLNGDTIKIKEAGNFSVSMTATKHVIDVDYIMANV